MNSKTKLISIANTESIEIGNNIRRLLDDRHVSDNELAEALDLPIVTIRRIISGETGDPRISTLQRIAGYFGVAVDELLGKAEGATLRQIKKNKPLFLPILDWLIVSQVTLNTLDLTQWKKWHPITFAEEYQLGDDAFILESTPSMYPRFSPGTLFVIDPDSSPLDGDLILIKRKENGDIFLRELMIDLPERKLLPLTPNSQEITFSEKNHIIIGSVILTLLYKRKNSTENS